MQGIDFERVRLALKSNFEQHDIGDSGELCLEPLVSLMQLFAGLDPPPDPFSHFGLYARYKQDFINACISLQASLLEESFLLLYSYLHGNQLTYSPAERKRLDALQGYWNHAGGLSPILKAGGCLRPEYTSVDFGAGNGLQGLLLQKLYPHKKTVQIELSGQACEEGRALQQWLGIEDEVVNWRVADVMDSDPSQFDFVYLYRPVRPDGPGRKFYQNFAKTTEQANKPLVIFSIADCLTPFLRNSHVVFYSDGHLTCLRHKNHSIEPGRKPGLLLN